MLNLVVQSLNTIKSFIYFLYVTCYSIGKLSTSSLVLIFELLTNILLFIRDGTVVIFEEFVHFIQDINYGITRLSLCVYESIKAIFDGVSFVAGGIQDSVAFCISTGKIRTSQLHLLIAGALDALLKNIVGALVLIGNAMWSIPSALFDLFFYFALAIKLSIDLFLKIIAYSILYLLEYIFNAGMKLVSYLKLLSLRSVFGLTFLCVILVKSEMSYSFFKRVVRFLVQGINYVGNRVIRLIKAIIRYLVRRLNDLLTLQESPPEIVDNYNEGSPTNIRIQGRIPMTRKHASEGDISFGDTNLCIVCQERSKCIVLLPCRHLCMCRVCCEYLATTSQNNCPLCRVNIKQKVYVYT